MSSERYSLEYDGDEDTGAAASGELFVPAFRA